MKEKKQYEAPEMKVYQVKLSNVIATSTRATQNEEYLTGDTSGWY